MARILVADDDTDIRELVRLKLELSGHEVHEATDGQAALDRCADLLPDLLVLDVMMPRLTGPEVLDVLRRDARYEQVRRLPVVLLTAMVESADVDKGLNAGADAYVAKPFSPRELSAVVEELLIADRPE